MWERTIHRWQHCLMCSHPPANVSLHRRPLAQSFSPAPALEEPHHKAHCCPFCIISTPKRLIKTLNLPSFYLKTGDNRQSNQRNQVEDGNFLTSPSRPAFYSPMASTNCLTSEGSGAPCCVCRNLDFHSPLPGDDADMPLGEAWPFITFSRHFSEFVKSADQGCPLCWVLAGIGRSWDDSIDPATEIYVDLGDYGDAQVSCMKYQPSLHIYLPEEHCLGQSRNMPIDLLFAKT